MKAALYFILGVLSFSLVIFVEGQTAIGNMAHILSACFIGLGSYMCLAPIMEWSSSRVKKKADIFDNDLEDDGDM